MENDDLYLILGVEKNSTDADIKKNYRRLAKEFHPDKNPEAGDKFKEISFAYEVLSNPEKRKTYDTYGLKGLQEGSEGFADASDLFSSWFPFSGASGCSSRRGKAAADVVVSVHATLEEIYSGDSIKNIEFKRSEHCPQCNGQGGPSDAMEKCTSCNGAGRTPVYEFMGLSAFETVCSTCFGRGSIIKDDLRCDNCSGSGLVEEHHKREITVPLGAPHMLKIPYRSEGNQPLEGERGDLIVVIVQEKHPVFVRMQNDLYLQDITLNLTQALCGFVHCFTHLDGRTICITNKPGEVIKHGQRKVLSKEGMPVYQSLLDHGDLLVEFHVNFPENNFASMEELVKLESLLPPREPFIMPEDPEEVFLVDVQPRAEGAHGGSADEEEYEGPRFEGVQCQTA